MKHLIKIILIIASFFALTFILVKITGVLSVEQIKAWFLQAKELSPYYMGGIVVLLLFSDLFIAIPTLTVITLSGYFLGFQYGAISSLIGLTLSGLTGYGLSNAFGEKIFKFLLKKEEARKEAKQTFIQHGFIMILLSRAMPILPEVTACLAGMTNMKFAKFVSSWLLSSVPYVIIISYAGSVSSLENPKPAIYTAIGVSATLWLGWYLFNKKRKKSVAI
ncbi:MAG: VTT domain-containing protein [Flavobacteriaceae bacterium]|nr:VTT domain-containing protein [Flavobacteriaceae bacterium]